MFANVSSPICMDIAFPDVCLTPIVVPVPIPYPNIAMRIMTVDFCVNVTIWCMPAHHIMSFVPLTLGDTSGVLLGVLSGMIMSASHNILGSFVVMFDGLPATRMLHPTFQNGMFGNAPGLSLIPGQFGTLILV